MNKETLAYQFELKTTSGPLGYNIIRLKLKRGCGLGGGIIYCISVILFLKNVNGTFNPMGGRDRDQLGFY